MRQEFGLAGTAVFMLVLACTSREGLSQADPYWMSSWNHALRNRPTLLQSSSRIASTDERGTPLLILGQVFAPDGRTPAAAVAVHAYHRDSEGFDFGPGDATLPTWRLQGWARTDEDGRFEFRTIRPAPDHMGREAAHIHITLESARHGRQWAPTFYLADDPLVTSGLRQASAARGEFGNVLAVATATGGQQVRIRIRLKEQGDF